MDFAIRDHLGRGSGPEARARELYPVNDIHLIHHLVTEDLDKVEVGDVEGDICAMLRMKVFPGKDMWVLGRGCSLARSSDAIPLVGHVGRRRWFFMLLRRAAVW